MSDEEHFKKLERLYQLANCNEYYSPKITISKGLVELIIPVQEKFFHAASAVHGSVYFKALDDAAFFAVNSMVKEVLVLTVSFHLHLMRPISSGEMRAAGRVVQASQNLFVAESVLFNSHNKEIARGTGNFVKSRIELIPEIGYRI
jgi:uncharacterized protein (TIGR00369 family)